MADDATPPTKMIAGTLMRSRPVRTDGQTIAWLALEVVAREAHSSSQRVDGSASDAYHDVARFARMLQRDIAGDDA